MSLSAVKQRFNKPSGEGGELEVTAALENLRVRHEIISIESMSFGNMLQALPKRLPGFVADVKTFIGNFMGSDAPSLEIFKIDRKVNQDARKLDYMTLMPLPAYVPAGMTCNYSQYLDVLEDIMDDIENINKDTLNPTIKWVAKMLSNPSSLSSLVGGREFRNIKFTDIEKHKASVQTCFSKRSTNDKVTFGDVTSSLHDWEDVGLRMKKLQERYTRVDRKKVIDGVTEITEALDKLIYRIENQPDEYKVAGPIMKNISDAAYNVAQEVEFFSVFSFQLQQMDQAMSDTQDSLKRALK